MVSVPALSGAKSSSARAPIRAAAMPASEISNAMAGGGSCRMRLMGLATWEPLFIAETRRRGDTRENLLKLLRLRASVLRVNSMPLPSMNVTLLISRRVVIPERIFSTAESRRNVMPSSRAARLISEVDRLSRIISRMRSLKSSSS